MIEYENSLILDHQKIIIVFNTILIQLKLMNTKLAVMHLKAFSVLFLFHFSLTMELGIVITKNCSNCPNTTLISKAPTVTMTNSNFSREKCSEV